MIDVKKIRMMRQIERTPALRAYITRRHGEGATLTRIAREAGYTYQGIQYHAKQMRLVFKHEKLEDRRDPDMVKHRLDTIRRGHGDGLMAKQIAYDLGISAQTMTRYAKEAGVSFKLWQG